MGDDTDPWDAVNAAGWVRVDDAETDEAAYLRINADAAVWLAEACSSARIGCLDVSSDLVVAGDGDRPLVERDPPRPLGAYGRSKAAMEARCASLPRSLVIRTAAFFSPHDAYNFAFAVTASLTTGRPFAAAHDNTVSPAFVPLLIDTALDLLIDEAEGIWHVSNGELDELDELDKLDELRAADRHRRQPRSGTRGPRSRRDPGLARPPAPRAPRAPATCPLRASAPSCGRPSTWRSRASAGSGSPPRGAACRACVRACGGGGPGGGRPPKC